MRRIAWVLVAVGLLLGAGMRGLPAAAQSPARLEPQEGVYFGMNIRWDEDSIVSVANRLGHTPAVVVRFFNFPFTPDDLVQLEDTVSQAALAGAMVMITLEPFGGLETVTPQVAEDLAIRLAAYNAAGVPIFVRFAHEMNGSWYPWCQKPEQYKAAFRLIAEAVHARAPFSAMVWAPNYGGGYPFSGGVYEAQPGTPEFEALDTNNDNVLSMEDDMYAPYYPGDDVVDWVGMSLYHWGHTYPWRENEIPEVGKFIEQLQGRYNGLGGDDRAVPDFHQEYGVARNKPIAIPETAAMYNTEEGGADELVMKRAWWRQVFSAQTRTELPRVRMISWFEIRKHETEIGGALVNWAVTLDPAMAAAFRADLPDYLIFAEGTPILTRTYLPALVR